MAKITVVVPIYNTAATLQRCVNSVLAQTFEDFELILINDGSKDNSDELCRKYAENDSRIRYIFQENRGLSAVRNRGIDLSQSEYICFLDSDDYIDNGCLEFMLSRAQKTTADIVLCSYFIENNAKATPIEVTEAVLSKENINSYIVDLKAKNVFDPAWNKLYRLAFLKSSGVRMPEGEYFEDTAFNLNLLKFNPKICVYNRCFYHYVMNVGSITHRYNPQKLETLKERARLLKSATKGIDKYCDFYFIKSVFSAFIDMFLSLEKAEIFKTIASEISKQEFICAAKNAYYSGLTSKLIIKAAQSGSLKTVYNFCRLSYLLKYKMQSLFLKVKGK